MQRQWTIIFQITVKYLKTLSIINANSWSESKSTSKFQFNELLIPFCRPVKENGKNNKLCFYSQLTVVGRGNLGVISRKMKPAVQTTFLAFWKEQRWMTERCFQFLGRTHKNRETGLGRERAPWLTVSSCRRSELGTQALKESSSQTCNIISRGPKSLSCLLHR